jgi:hypothetical protein
MKDKQRRAMFAKMNNTPLPKPIIFKRVIDKPNHKVYRADNDAQITFIDDGVGNYPITVIVDKEDGITYKTVAVDQFRTRGEAIQRIKQLKLNYRKGQLED